MTATAIADRLELHDLLVRYACALDAGDVATVVGCFTADATLESPAIGSIAGRDAIRAFAERFAAQRAAGVQFRHLVTNIAAEIDGDRARDCVPAGVHHRERREPTAAARALRMHGGQRGRRLAF